MPCLGKWFSGFCAIDSDFDCSRVLGKKTTMGKEGELWDDSALLNAFDDAMSKYKMHGMRSSNASVSGVAGKSVDEALRDKEDGSNAEAEIDEVNPLPVKDNNHMDSQITEPNVDSSNSLSTQDALGENTDYSYSQGTDDYNQLMAQYYEVEEKRQQILVQLQQLGGWNYQTNVEGSCSAAQWGNPCSSQEYVTNANQVSNAMTACPCCPYASQTMVASDCASYPACSVGGNGACVGASTLHASGTVTNGNSSSAVDDDILGKAMGIAERAISSLKIGSTGISNVNEENKDKQKVGSEMAQNTSSEPDLATVLNAWYSAGVYTSKYLMEQSLAKRRPQ